MGLLHARGELDPYARRMAKHATHHATGRGRLDDVEGGLIPGYKARHGIGRRSAYTDLGRLVQAGLLRQVHAACPGRTVTYQMCVPETLPADLPAGLRSELRKRWARPSTAARAETRRAAPASGEAVRVRIPMAEGHRLMADVATVRVGSLTAPRPRETLRSCGRLHTSPLLKRALPQPLRSRPPQGIPPPPDGPMGQASGDEEGLLADVEARCMARWGAQRAAGGLPDARARSMLRPLLRSALRWHTSADVIDAVTADTRSARDLGAVAATRLRRMILAARRAAALPTDDDGARYRQLQDDLARGRAAAMDASASARHATRQALEAIRGRQRHHPPGRARLHAVPRPAPPAPRPTQPPPPAAPATSEALDSADLQMLRQAMANATTGTPRR